jgi:hypothetical protein
MLLFELRDQAEAEVEALQVAAVVVEAFRQVELRPRPAHAQRGQKESEVPAEQGREAEAGPRRVLIVRDGDRHLELDVDLERVLLVHAQGVRVARGLDAQDAGLADIGVGAVAACDEIVARGVDGDPWVEPGSRLRVNCLRLRSGRRRWRRHCRRGRRRLGLGWCRIGLGSCQAALRCAQARQHQPDSLAHELPAKALNTHRERGANARPLPATVEQVAPGGRARLAEGAREARAVRKPFRASP